MAKPIDATDILGFKSGDFTAVSYVGTKKLKRGRTHLYECECSLCGAKKIIDRHQLLKHSVTRCGEHRRKLSRLYSVWNSMNARCSNPKDKRYKTYGARGISVCEEWQGQQGMNNFYKWALTNGYDINAKRGECTIDRIDVDRGYYPDNCRWVDNTTQMNNRTDNYYVTYNGETKSVTLWARQVGLDPNTLYQRLAKLNWNVDKAMTEPVRKGVIV